MWWRLGDFEMLAHDNGLMGIWRSRELWYWRFPVRNRMYRLFHVIGFRPERIT